MESSPKKLVSETYFLKYWLENTQNEQTGVWRFSLTNIDSGQRFGFATPEALLAYIKTAMESWKENDNEPS